MALRAEMKRHQSGPHGVVVSSCDWVASCVCVELVLHLNFVIYFLLFLSLSLSVCLSLPLFLPL